MNVVKVGKGDIHQYERVKVFSPAMNEEAEDGEKECPTYPKLLEDTFHTLFKSNAEFEDSELVDKAHEPNLRFLQETVQTKEFKELQSLTMRDEFFSAVASMNFARKFLKHVPEDEKEKIKENNSIAGFAGDETGEPMEGVDYNIDWDQVRRAIREDLKEAEREASDMSDALAVCGSLDHNYPPEKLSFDRAAKMVKRLKRSPKLKKIMELGGRLKNIALDKRMNRTDKIPTEITDVKLGSDLFNQLPIEIMMMGDEDFSDDWMKRYSEGALQCYKLEGEEQVGKGPIVMAIDESTSMMGFPETFAKALFYPMAYIAREEKRNLCSIRFNTDVKETILELQDKPEDIMHICESFYGGGTRFDPPMLKAIEIIESDSKYEDADIFYLTDGISGFTPEVQKKIIEAKERLKFNVFVVIIGNSQGAEAFNGIADKVWSHFNFERDGDDMMSVAFAR